MLAIFSPPDRLAAEGLHRFAPNEISIVRAYAHVWAARVAAARYNADPDMVLAISYHESRFTPDTVTPGPAGTVSCGAMTPYPTIQCPHQTLLAQYLEGTRHWTLWNGAPAVHSAHEGLLGYAGGYALIQACRQGVVLRHGHNLCKTPEVFEAIRTQILKARGATHANSHGPIYSAT